MEKRNSITLTEKDIAVSVSVFLFKEGDTYIAYCPSLDLSGYNTSEDSAKDDFEYMLREWLKEQVANGTLQHDLASHGWNVEQNIATEPSMVDLLHYNQSAGKVLALPEYRKTNVHAEIFCR